MSQESALWLNTMQLIGFTEKRGHAWHYRANLQDVDPVTGHVGNHYAGPIPVEHVRRRLFDWTAVEIGLPDVHTADGIRVATSAHKAIAHGVTGDLFGIFTHGYQPHQYQDRLLVDVSTILDTHSSDLGVASAGLLKKGGRAYVTVELPDTVTTPQGVEFRPFLVAAGSHDGSLSTTYKAAIQAVVCDNTLAAALSEEGRQIKIKHSRYSNEKVTDIRDALKILHVTSDAFAASVAELCETTVTDTEWYAFLDEYVPVPKDRGPSQSIADKKRSSLIRLWMSDSRVAPWKGTAFGVVQAGNTWMSHESTVRGVDARVERNMINAVTGKSAEHDALVLSSLNKVLARSRG